MAVFLVCYILSKPFNEYLQMLTTKQIFYLSTEHWKSNKENDQIKEREHYAEIWQKL